MPLFWLGAVTALSLILHVLRAGLFAWVELELAGGRAPRLPGFIPPGLRVGLILEIALAASVLACAVAGLIWLYGASARAHALTARMKHSPRSSVVWFLVPLINLFMPLSVAYDLWKASGGDPNKGRMILVWFGAYALSTLPCWMWVFGTPPNLLGQVIIASSGLASLAMARRITRMQAIAETAAEFAAADEADGPVSGGQPPIEFPMGKPEALEPTPRSVRVVEPREAAGPGVIYAPRERP